MSVCLKDKDKWFVQNEVGREAQYIHHDLELYPYIVKTWDQICFPSDDDEIYPEGNSWKWDSETRSYANG